MNTSEIAQRLVALCRETKWETAQRELYADDARSLEAEPGPAFPQETRGLAAIVEKGRKFDSMVEQFHSIDVSEPIVADHSFACTMRMDVTMKGQGRFNMTELCVYEVKNGRIVAERFYP